MKKLFIKYKYFTPIVGFILFVIDIFVPKYSVIEKYYTDKLGESFCIYTMIFNMPMFIIIPIILS